MMSSQTFQFDTYHEDEDDPAACTSFRSAVRFLMEIFSRRFSDTLSATDLVL